MYGIINIVMCMNNKIGVFDSGIGGMSTLNEIRKLLPNENFVYYADSKNNPYGEKTDEELNKIVCDIVDYFISINVKMIVIACNTATVAAVTKVRAKYPDIPIIGIEPALKPAALYKPDGRILVMATGVTLTQVKFKKLMDNYSRTADIYTLPCPGLVEFIERGETEGEAFEAFLNNLLKDYIDNPPDAIVLGCTHYPFAKKAILKVMDNKPVIFDGGNGTARETLHQLELHNITASRDTEGKVTYLNSNPEEIELCKKLFNEIYRGN